MKISIALPQIGEQATGENVIEVQWRLLLGWGKTAQNYQLSLVGEQLIRVANDLEELINLIKPLLVKEVEDLQ
jgi:hypothetical protein